MIGPIGGREPDPSLRRVERDSALACAAMAVVALVVPGGGTSGALGVIGGGLLMAFSYRAIRGGVDGLVGRLAPSEQAGGAPSRRPAMGWTLFTFVGRYVVIGVGAWLLLARLRAHPVGLLAGVTAPVVAMTIEAARLQRRH